MKSLSAAVVAVLVASASAQPTPTTPITPSKSPAPVAVAPQAPNTLTKAEAAAGWKLLFDGKTTTGWRGYKKPAFPGKGWTVENGTLHTTKGGGGGDIITTDQYGDFELSVDWRVGKAGNSGIIFRCIEKYDNSWQTGPEIQILDDVGYPPPPPPQPPLHPSQLAGSLYDLVPAPKEKVLKPAGEFNTSRIRLKDGLLQHFLNGVKIIEVRMDGPDMAALIKKSKFKDYEGFGTQPKGFIALQEHGDEVAFRNIKIRDLAAPMPGEVSLFSGKDMKGWTFFLNDNGKMENVWSVTDGTIVCMGNPAGYIRTEKDYTNYVLKLEWRFSPVTKKAGNSGVLLRLQAPDKVWPKSVEAQLQSGSAGDFWNIDEVAMKTDPSRLNGRNTRKTHGAEYAIGEWNEYEITVDHSNITLRVNGEVLNNAWDVAEAAGKIGLQSEGAEIHFRNIRLAPIN